MASSAMSSPVKGSCPLWAVLLPLVCSEANSVVGATPPLGDVPGDVLLPGDVPWPLPGDVWCVTVGRGEVDVAVAGETVAVGAGVTVGVAAVGVCAVTLDCVVVSAWTLPCP